MSSPPQLSRMSSRRSGSTPTLSWPRRAARAATAAGTRPGPPRSWQRGTGNAHFAASTDSSAAPGSGWRPRTCAGPTSTARTRSTTGWRCARCTTNSSTAAPSDWIRTYGSSLGRVLDPNQHRPAAVRPARPTATPQTRHENPRTAPHPMAHQPGLQGSAAHRLSRAPPSPSPQGSGVFLDCPVCHAGRTVAGQP